MKKIKFPNPLVLLFFLIIIQFSCTKDSDLLAEYIIEDSIDIQETNVDNTDSSNSESNDSESSSTGDQPQDQTNQESKELSTEVVEWKQMFDEEWSRALPFYTDQTTGRETSGQRRYYDFRVIDGLLAIFQATGDTKYLDDLFWYVDRVKGLAIQSADGYYDWPKNGVNYQLYDGHGLRNIFKVLWILKKYPSLKAQSNYQQKYDEYLDWFKTNLWDKWKSRGNKSVMHGNTHMSSHMASNMALYLYLLTDNPTEKDEYLSWVTAWNDDVDSKYNWGGPSGTGFRDQLRLNEPHNGYVWAGNWGSMSGSNDLTHTNACIQAVINQHQQGIGWNSSEIDIFINTINNVMDDGDISKNSHPFFINLADNGNNVKTMSYGWCMLGRFNEETQARLRNFSVSHNKSSYYYNVYIGNMAYNRAYLDGNLIYSDAQ